MAAGADIIYYLVLPSLLFFGILIFWLIQSTILLFVSRRFILPVLYKNKLTEWFIVEVAIAVHELSHLTAAFFTGSEINLKESFVTSKGGRIAARTSQTIGGWISTLIAAFAPAFVPSLVLFVVFIALFGVNVPLNKLSKVDPFSLDISICISNLNRIIDPILNSLLETIFNPSFITLLFFYFLIVSSLTSCPSEDDWRAAFNVLLSFPVIPIFITFLLINYISLQFNFNFTLFVIFLLTIIAIYLIIGIVLNLILVAFILLLNRLWKIFTGRVVRI